jgi:hypothetical protein
MAASAKTASANGLQPPRRQFHHRLRRLIHVPSLSIFGLISFLVLPGLPPGWIVLFVTQFIRQIAVQGSLDGQFGGLWQ